MSLRYIPSVCHVLRVGLTSAFATFFPNRRISLFLASTQSFRQVTGSHILRVQIYLRAYSTRAHSWRRQRDSHYIFTHLLCSIPMPYTSVGLEYRFSIHFGRTKQKNGDELRTLRSLRTSQTDPSKIDRAYGTCVNFFSLVANPTKFFPLKVAR